MSDAPTMLPLDAHTLLHAHSEKEYAAWCASRGVPQNVRSADDSGAFEVRINRVEIPGGALEVASGGPCPVRVETTPGGDAYQLMLPVRGCGRLQLDSGCIPLSGGHRGALVGPDQAYSLALSSQWADLSVYIERSAMLLAAERWAGRSLRTAPTYDVAVPLTASTLRRLRATTALLFREAEEGCEDARLETLIQRCCVELLRSVPGDHQRPAVKEGLLPSHRHVRIAEAFMEANLARPLQLADLAAEVGVGARALQKAFRRHVGERPLAVLKRLRLERARTRLLHERDLPVQEAARRSGMTHPGRFSLDYRKTFGESPSETRRRARPTPFYCP